MPNYVAALLEIRSAELDKANRNTIRGTLGYGYDVGGPPTLQQRNEYVASLTAKGYKVGLRVRRAQRIERLAFPGRDGGEVVLQPSPAVSEELQRALPCEADEHWVGLEPPKGAVRRYEFREDPRRIVITYEFTLIVTDVRTTPQPVAMVLTYGTEAFARHYMLQLLVLTDQAGIRVTTEAVR